MNSTHIISQDVFDKIRSRFQNLEMGDEQGGVTTDPKEARFFDFDFVVEGENLGRVSISINERGTLKVFYSQGILEDSNDFVHELWYDFLREMRMFAKRRLLRFDTRDITKSNLNKTDFQYLATNGPKDQNMNMSESAKFEGSKKTSYRVLEKTKLIAKHKESIESESAGARSRKNNIKALYIENSDGERFKYPFIHIAGAKAMQRHVANGGKPYDEIGNKIIEMSEETMQLTSFKRHIGKPDGMNQRVNEITSKTNGKLEMLRRTLEGMCNQSYYEKWAESFVPNKDDVQLDQTTMEDYKDTFTVSSFREDLAQYFPLIHKIMHETGEIDLEEYVGEGKEETCEGCGMTESKCECAEEESVKSAADSIEEFVEWADRLEEGRLEPDTLAQLKELIDSGLTLDEAGRSAIDALQGIGIYDEELENALEELSKVNSDADPKDTILAWLAKDDPEAAKEFGYKQEQPEPDAEKMPTEDTAGMTPTVRDIAEMVYSFFDRETGKFPKGKTGVEVHVGKELGEQAGELAKQLVDHLQPDEADVTEEAQSLMDPAVEQDFNEWSKVLHPHADGGHAFDLIRGDETTVRNILAYVKQNPGVLGKEITDTGRTIKDAIIDIKNEFPQEYQAATKSVQTKESGPDKSQVPAYKRKEQGGDWKMSTKDLEDEKTKSPTSSAGLARKKAELGMSEELSSIMKLAGLGEGSGSKEKQKTPYRDISGPEYKAAAEKQKQKMAKDKAAEPGKALLAKKK